MEMEMEMVVAGGLVSVLRAVWVTTTLPIVVVSLPCSCSCSCSSLSFLYAALLAFARRGKTMHSSSQRFTVPQRFFRHFYVVGAAWTTTLLVVTWSYAHTVHQSNNRIWSSVFLLLLLELQVLARLFDSFYIFNYSSSARMHLVGYLTGICYYPATSLSLCCVWAPEAVKYAVSEFIAVGSVDVMQSYKPEWWIYLSPLLLQLEWYQWMGASIFIWGWLHQRRCHAILGSLRKKNGEESEKYVVPYGDWFELVSSPHYLAEIVMYLGLVVASGGTDLTIWLLFGFVVANLSFAAAETQRWYLEKFSEYPRNRRVIVPFVY